MAGRLGDGKVRGGFMFGSKIGKVRTALERARKSLRDGNARRAVERLDRALQMVDDHDLESEIEPELATGLEQTFSTACVLARDSAARSRHDDLLRRLVEGPLTGFEPEPEATLVSDRDRRGASSETESLSLADTTLPSESPPTARRVEARSGDENPTRLLGRESIGSSTAADGGRFMRADRMLAQLETGAVRDEDDARLSFATWLRLTEDTPAEDLPGLVRRLERLHRLRPGYGIGAYYLARHYHLNGNHESACDFYAQVQGDTARHSAYLHRYAKALMKLGEDAHLRRAVDLMYRALESDRNHPDLHRDLGQVFMTLYLRRAREAEAGS